MWKIFWSVYQGLLYTTEINVTKVCSCKNVTKIPVEVNNMTEQLEIELTQDGGALNEAEKSIEEGKNNLQESVDDIIESVSVVRIKLGEFRLK